MTLFSILFLLHLRRVKIIFILYPLQGMDSGFGDDEAYNVYDKPWREEGTISKSIYRPSKNLDNDLYGDDLEAIMKQKRLECWHLRQLIFKKFL